MFKYVLSVALALFCCNAAEAACPTFPYTFSNGTTADGGQVTSNFTNVTTCFAQLASPDFTGNVGIGTTTPNSSLVINPGTNNSQLYFGLPQTTGYAGTYGAAIGTYAGSSASTLLLEPYAGLVMISRPGGGAGYLGITYPNKNTYGVYLASSGNSYFNGGSVGIGTTSPLAPLDVYNSTAKDATIGAWSGSASYNAIYLNGQTATSGSYNILSGDGEDLFLNRPTGYNIHFRENNADQMFIQASTGYVGIGTTSPTAALTVNGGISATGTGNDIIAANGAVGWGSSTTGSSALCYGGAFGIYFPLLCTSLSQYKNNQRTLSLGLGTLMQLHPVEFDWDKQHGGRHDLGFVAQEVEKVNPLLAEYDYKDGPKGKLIGVKYMQMTALLTKAVQELKTANDAQAARIEKQEAALTQQQTEIAQLQRQVSALVSGPLRRTTAAGSRLRRLASAAGQR